MSFREIRKNDEHWRDNLIGCTFSKRLEETALRRHGYESALVRLDAQKQRFRELLAGRKAELLPNLHESVMCAVLEPKSRKIVDVGFNVSDDIITDNFGKWLAAFIRVPSTGNLGVTMKDSAGTNRTVNIYLYGIGLFNYTDGAIGTKIQLGSGITTPARSDYAVGTAFGNSPENAPFDTNTGSYAVGYISFSGAITAGGAGTVTESGFFGHLRYNTGYADFMLFHDLLESGVGFTAGQTLNVSYSIAL